MGDSSSSDGNQLYDKGWKQGTYIVCNLAISDELHSTCWASSKDLASNLDQQLSDHKNVLILLSQACDIVASSAIEPSLEFVIAKKVRKNHPHFLNLDARSSRFLELQLDGIWRKAEASKILYIPKPSFLAGVNKLGLKPVSLIDCDVEILARWRANRYMRIALPDAFMAKISPLINNGLFNEGLEHAGGLYLSLDTYSESEQYTVRLFALHRKGSPAVSFDALFNKMESILEEFSKIDGVNCPYIDGEKESFFDAVTPAMRRHEVTIDLRDHFIRWNFDYLSLGKDDSEGIDLD